MSGITQLIKKHAPDLERYEELYRSLHVNPELSLCEEWTSITIAEHLRQLGLKVKTQIGGYGVVGILHNGEGKTVLLRAELDALPLPEKTSLPFASKKTMKDANGVVSPAMHACGHDLHMSSLLATMDLLGQCRKQWKGTVIALFQPSEENALGAKAMIDDGLFDAAKHNVPVPDISLGGHCMPLRAGLVKTRLGVINASADSFRITIYGRGGHAARPHNTVDPVIIACNIVTKLQQIVSRQVDPLKPAVLTVGSIHAGSAANVIAEEAEIQVNMRTFDESLRQHMIGSMTKIINAEAQIYDAPKTPLIEHITHFPLLENDVDATTVVAEAMAQHFGPAFALDAVTSTGSEDFAALSVPPHVVPIVFWNYGCIDPVVWDHAEKENTLSAIAGNHSRYFEPILQPSLKVAMEAYSVATLAFLSSD